MEIIELGKWVNAAVASIPAEWTMLFVLVVSAVSLGIWEYSHLAKRAAVLESTRTGVTQKPVPISYDRLLRGMPFFVVSRSARFLLLAQHFLSIIFVLFVFVSWSLPWTLDFLVSKTYALAEREALYEAGSFRAKIIAFQQALMVPILFQVVATASHLYVRWVRTKSGRSSPIAGTVEVIAFSMATIASVMAIWPFAEENIVTLVQVSISASDTRSMLAQLFLGPIYTQFLLIGLGAIYVVVSSCLAILRGVWSLFKAEDPRLPKADGFRAKINRLQNGIFNSMMSIGAGATASFALTTFVLIAGAQLGEMPSGGRLVPAPRILVINAIADGLTLFATCSLLMLWVNQSRAKISEAFSAPESLNENLHAGVRPLMLVVVVDLLIAASLAVIGTMVSLSGTQWEVTFKESLFVLFGLTPDGGKVNFNEVFWLMHSTFLPTIFYLAILLTSCVFSMIWITKISSLMSGVTRWLENNMKLVVPVFKLGVMIATPTYIIDYLARMLPKFVSADEYAATVNSLLAIVPSSIGM